MRNPEFLIFNLLNKNLKSFTLYEIYERSIQKCNFVPPDVPVHLKNTKSKIKRSHSDLCETEWNFINKVFIFRFEISRQISFNIFLSCPFVGIKHWEQTGLDQTHPGGDPGAHHSSERSPEGAHSHPQTQHSQASQRTKVNTTGVREWNIFSPSENDGSMTQSCVLCSGI